MFRQVSVSAPSKVILHGEHAVVYGKTALAASLDLRTRMSLTPVTNGLIEVDFPDIGVKQSWPATTVEQQLFLARPHDLGKELEVDQDFLAHIHDFLEVTHEDLKLASLTCFFYLYSVICDDHVIPMRITVESEIPIGAGLGSSAALSVCLAAGLMSIKTSNSKMDEERLQKTCKLALLSEKILHGSPSGIDNTVSTYGGLIQFNSGKLTTITDPPELRVLLVNTKVPRSTKLLVGEVKKRYHDNPKIVRPILEAIDGISHTCLDTLDDMTKSGDTKERYEKLGQLISYNQKLLEALGVSHPHLEEVCKIVQNHGLFAKLTGAGGGGFAYVLLPPYVQEKDIDVAKEKLAKRGFVCCETRLGVQGVQVQHDNKA